MAKDVVDVPEWGGQVSVEPIGEYLSRMRQATQVRPGVWVADQSTSIFRVDRDWRWVFRGRGCE